MMRQVFLFGLACLLAFGGVEGASLTQAQKFFELGNAAYERGDFAKAEMQYRHALDEGIADHKLYYNYANALFRSDKLGLAILYWEKAAKLSPNNPDIEYNLRFARARIIDKLPEPTSNFLTRALWSLHSGYSLNVGLWLALVSFSLFFAALFAFRSESRWIKGLGLLGLLLTVLVLLGLTPSLVYKIRQQETVNTAIVLKPVLEIYSGPGDSYQLLTRVHEGTKFIIEQINGDWASVKLNNGTGGWARFAELGKI